MHLNQIGINQLHQIGLFATCSSHISLGAEQQEQKINLWQNQNNRKSKSKVKLAHFSFLDT
jgi:hypothetical protein